ncbi:GGDEF domain-containing protein [Desulfolutivibrio sp.]|uniref:GGDEF domain-containing protein n=1 Tax=Desulfolutivibrio sp. TaxID=2773296 RepID=UPI002F96B327
MNPLETTNDETQHTLNDADSRARVSVKRHIPRFLRDGWDAVGRMVEKVSVKAKMAVVLFCVMIVPTAVILYLVESHASRDTALYLAAYLAIALALLSPLAGFLSRFLVIKDIREINSFCMEVKRGNYAVRFELPVEDEEEHDILRLKRNLDWMTHLIGSRETRLRVELEKTDTTKKMFEELSNRDPLTGLGNRRQFETRIRELACRARHTGHPFHLMLIDCDKFKQVNDVHGHQTGDMVLTLLGTIIRESVREQVDGCYRLGGDEFGILLPTRDTEAARVVGERIRTRFAASQQYGCTVSIGGAAYRSATGPCPDADEELRDLIARSDKVVYAVKKLGGDRVTLEEGHLAVLNRSAS